MGRNELRFLRVGKRKAKPGATPLNHLRKSRRKQGTMRVVAVQACGGGVGVDKHVRVRLALGLACACASPCVAEAVGMRRRAPLA